jgi:hypothetical protein
MRAKAWLDTFAVPQWAQRVIARWPHQVVLSYAQFEELLNSHLKRLNDQQQARIFEAVNGLIFIKTDNRLTAGAQVFSGIPDLVCSC